jgi:integrase
MSRNRRSEVRKFCTCPPRRRAKCPHAWYFDYTPRGGARVRFSLDIEYERRIESKTEADALGEDIRQQILDGTFRRAADRRQAAQSPIVTPGVETFRIFGAKYVERVCKVRERNKSWKDEQSRFNRLAAFPLPPTGELLGDKPLNAITEDDLEVAFSALRSKATSTRNHYVQLIRASFRWATRKGHLTKNPLTEESSLKRGKHARRDRRLTPDGTDAGGRLVTAGEERRLLAVAPPRLQNLIIAAVETCCRLGELLTLQWQDVNLERGQLTIRGEHTKDAETRVLPISARLAAILTMARTDPTGQVYPPAAFVFGELGERTGRITRAWSTCVLKAHGHRPTYEKTGLSAASRTALQAIDLHFHDLRHEGASRLLEAGWPLHHIQEMLGHASLEQTSTYLNVQRGGLQESMRRLDQMRERDSQGNLKAIRGETEHRPSCPTEEPKTPEPLPH